ELAGGPRPASVRDSIRAPGGAGRSVAVVDTAVLLRQHARARSNCVGPMASGRAPSAAGGICSRLSHRPARVLVFQQGPSHLRTTPSTHSVGAAPGRQRRNEDNGRPTASGSLVIRWARVDGRAGMCRQPGQTIMKRKVSEMERREFFRLAGGTLVLIPAGLFLVRCVSYASEQGQGGQTNQPRRDGEKLIYTSSVVVGHVLTFAIRIASM